MIKVKIFKNICECPEMGIGNQVYAKINGVWTEVYPESGDLKSDPLFHASDEIYTITCKYKGYEFNRTDAGSRIWSVRKGEKDLGEKLFNNPQEVMKWIDEAEKDAPTMSWNDIYEAADDKPCGSWELKRKDTARAEIVSWVLNKFGYDLEVEYLDGTIDSVEEEIDYLASQFRFCFNEDGYIVKADEPSDVEVIMKTADYLHRVEGWEEKENNAVGTMMKRLAVNSYIIAVHYSDCNETEFRAFTGSVVELKKVLLSIVEAEYKKVVKEDPDAYWSRTEDIGEIDANLYAYASFDSYSLSVTAKNLSDILTEGSAG